MKFSTDKKVFIILFLLILIAGLTFLFINDKGVLKYIEMKNKVSELEIKLEQLEIENNAMKSEIDSLEKKIPSKIEQIAREKFRMKRPNETAIDIEIK
jgi:cell division protein FtsL